MATINPFQAPINYAVDVQSPFEAALGGFKMGSVVAEAEAARAARERAQAAQRELTNLFKNPNATSADYARVTAFLPKDQASIVLQGFEAQTKEQQQNTLRLGTQVYTAIKSGNLPVAQMRLQEKAEALRNSGREKDAQGYDDLSNLIRLNPTNAQAIIGLNIAGLPGGKDFLDNADKALSTIRAESEAPSRLTEVRANANKAVTDSQLKVQELRAKLEAEPDVALQRQLKTELDQAQVDERRALATKAQVDAKFAERNVAQELKNKAATLGLTEAQTASAIAQGKKLDEESKKIVLELEALRASGGVDPAKKFEQEEKLRKEFQARTKVYGELGSTFSNLQASAQAKTGPGDIALITGFMKMLDPGSVVRETEFAVARDTAGLFDRLANQVQKLQSGQLFELNSKQRQEYVDLARQYLGAAQKKAADDKNALGVVVKNYRLNPENVFGPETTQTAAPSPAPASAPAPAPAPAATGMPSGFRVIR
jgi:hypothetical protein